MTIRFPAVAALRGKNPGLSGRGGTECGVLPHRPRDLYVAQLPDELPHVRCVEFGLLPGREVPAAFESARARYRCAFLSARTRLDAIAFSSGWIM